jgi:lipid-A-disaccharide synthase
MSLPIRVVIVCGEISGDRLGAGLLEELLKEMPTLAVEGVGGPRLRALGMKTWFDAEAISMMGFVTPLLNARSLYRRYRQVINNCLKNPPDIFISIDSPDFTLRCSKVLKAKGVQTIHYVSPSVWAWRKSRIHFIKAATDHMMVLFPFEMPIYQEHDIPVTLVGMKLADDIPMRLTPGQIGSARQTLGVNPHAKVVTLMAGSRVGELRRLIPIACTVAQKMLLKNPDLVFLAPVVNEKGAKIWEAAITNLRLPIQVVVNNTTDCLIAADVVLAKSGTTTLECMLYKKPMVVFYKVSFMNYCLAKCLISLSYFALPNLLAGKALVPEHIQKIDPDKIAHQLMEFLERGNDALLSAFDKIHQTLALGADRQAAKVVSRLLRDN